MNLLKKTTYFLCVLALAASCGKDNKSGNKGGGSPYGEYGMYSAYSTNGVSIAQVISENPCYGSNVGYNTAYNNNYVVNNQRQEVTAPIPNFNTVIPNGDMYVGVTSYGDVAAVIGNGGAPIFVAYVCPRSGYSVQGPSVGQLMSSVSLGAYSNCMVKQLVAATMRLQDGSTAAFRMLDFGSSANTKFTFCR